MSRHRRLSVRFAMALGCLSFLASACSERGQAASVGPTSMVTSAGRLDGVVTREGGAPAQGLVVTALNHGVAVVSTITSGSGSFSMRFVIGASEPLPADTLLTWFIQARTTVGAVSDSLVLRVPVAVRMTHNVNNPVVTNALLVAAY